MHDKIGHISSQMIAKTTFIALVLLSVGSADVFNVWYKGTMTATTTETPLLTPSTQENEETAIIYPVKLGNGKPTGKCRVGMHPFFCKLLRDQLQKETTDMKSQWKSTSKPRMKVLIQKSLAPKRVENRSSVKERFSKHPNVWNQPTNFIDSYDYDFNQKHKTPTAGNRSSAKDPIGGKHRTPTNGFKSYDYDYNFYDSAYHSPQYSEPPHYQDQPFYDYPDIRPEVPQPLPALRVDKSTTTALEKFLQTDKNNGEKKGTKKDTNGVTIQFSAKQEEIEDVLEKIKNILKNREHTVAVK